MKHCFALFLLLITASLHSEEIKIGAVLHLTGDLAMQSRAFSEGLELGIDECNQRKENPLKLIIEDGHNNPKASNSAVRKLINIDQVSATVLSSYFDIMTSGKFIEKNKVPTIVLWDSNPEIEEVGEYAFAIGPWTPSSGYVSADYAFDDLKTRKAVVISNQDSYSDSIANYFREHFKKRGGKIIDHFILDAQETNFRTILTKAKVYGADVLYTPVVFNLLPLYKQIKELNLDVQVVTSDIIADEHIQQAPEVFEGIYQTTLKDPDSAEYKKMAEKYQLKFNKAVTLPWFVAVAYDSIAMLCQATESGTGMIKEKLYSVQNFAGASSTISINSAGSSPQHPGVFQIKNKKFVLIK